VQLVILRWFAAVHYLCSPGANLHMAQLMSLPLTVSPVNPDWFYFIPHDAMLARVYATAIPSVCASVWLCVTRMLCFKTATFRQNSFTTW